MKITKRFGAGTNARREERDAAAGDFALDVEFNAPPGVTILFGASGSGKSLTLKCIAGLVQPGSGRIAVGDRILFDSAHGINLPVRVRGAGYVFQNLALFPHLTAVENIEFAITGVPRSERRSRALALMRNFRIEHTASRRIKEISGGEAQRVALARALACRPDMLLLDEPLSALDEAAKHDIISDLKNFNRELRLPIIYVTHSREEAVALGERAVVYERGRIVAHGEPVEVFRAPSRTSVARLTGVENIFEGSVVRRDALAGTMTVRLEEASGESLLEVPFGGDERERLVVAVRSGDILLATQEPRATSARNILHGRITSVEDKGAHVLVRVSCGVTWAVSVTRNAAAELNLSEGQEVWLAIKTYSCHLLDEHR